MKTLALSRTDRCSTFVAKTAKDVMMTNPLSINHHATIPEVAEFMTTKGISAAPVIDEAGRPMGVISRTDLVRYAGNEPTAKFKRRPSTAGEIMTPVVCFVRPATTLETVIDDLLSCMIHRLFVVDDHGVLVGVISAIDVLRSLQTAIATASAKRIAHPETTETSRISSSAS